jgi:hypothetical protein
LLSECIFLWQFGQRASCLLGKKNLAGSHEVHEVAQAVAILGKGGSKPIDFTAVNGFKTAAGGVGEHFLGETTGELIALLRGEDAAKVGGVFE